MAALISLPADPQLRLEVTLIRAVDMLRDWLNEVIGPVDFEPIDELFEEALPKASRYVLDELQRNLASAETAV